MKIISAFAVGLTIVALITWFSCNKKEQAVSPPLPGNEVITTMVLKVVNQNDATDTPSAKWIQLDPTGQNAPNLTLDTLNLKKGATYNLQVKFLDTLTDETSQILAKENYHLICFATSGGVSFAVTATDHDTNPQQYPVGLSNVFTAPSTAGKGALEVTLHHQPNIKNGSCSVGSVDMDCNFVINVQ